MKRYTDTQGNQVGTSKSMQGGCAQGCLGLIGLFFFICLILALIGALHG